MNFCLCELIERRLLFVFRFFSPLGMVPVISLVGFGLFDRGFPVVRLDAEKMVVLLAND